MNGLLFYLILCIPVEIRYRRFVEVKKIAAALCFSFLLTGIVFAENNNVQKVNDLIDEGLFTNESAIRQVALSLTDEQKDAVYSENEKPWWPFALNLGIGYGVGSYVQGDTKFAVASTVIDATCDIATIACYIGLCSALYDNLGSGTYDNTYEFTDDEIRTAAPWIIGMSVAVGAASVWRIIETIRPFNYAKEYNRKLKRSLYADDVSFMIVPAMISPDAVQLAVACKINY
ncbi:MAG TPA: hypothetical protein DCL73_09815 [Treponema sp.]|nr:hypothetical protein [Treponema sp.]